MVIQYSEQFLSDISKLNEKQKKHLTRRLSLFKSQPSHPWLNNHKLKGKLKDYCSINITGDFRAVYRYEPDKKQKGELVVKFVRLGTHSKLYG